MKYLPKAVFNDEKLGNKHNNVLIGIFQEFSKSFFKPFADSNLGRFSICFLK